MGYDQTDENHFLTTSSSSTVTILFKEIFSRSSSVFIEKKFDLSSIERKYLDARKEEEEEEEEEEDDEKESKKEEKEREKEEKKNEKKNKKNDD
jgi:penicillin-binding protein 2A